MIASARSEAHRLLSHRARTSWRDIDELACATHASTRWQCAPRDWAAAHAHALRCVSVQVRARLGRRRARARHQCKLLEHARRSACCSKFHVLMTSRARDACRAAEPLQRLTQEADSVHQMSQEDFGTAARELCHAAHCLDAEAATLRLRLGLVSL